MISGTTCVSTSCKARKKQYRRAAEVILKLTYMDDSMDSVNEREGVELYKQLPELWEKAGMQTHKWLSNSLKVLENILSQYRASEVIRKFHH